jgi:hypothetical protein
LKRKVVGGTWVLGFALASWHLCFLAAYDFKPAFWLFAMVLLVCYSLPFFILLKTQIPQSPLAKKYFMTTLFVLVLLSSILLPLQRFFPRYQSSALESLNYISVPAFQLALMGIFAVVTRIFPSRVG